MSASNDVVTSEATHAPTPTASVAEETPAAPVAAASETEAAASARHDAGRVLAAYDANGDGKLDADELKVVQADYEALAKGEVPPSIAAARVKAKAARDEANKAGLDAEEAARLAKKAARMESHMNGLDRNQRALNSLRGRYDKDGDGSLSAEELATLNYDIQTTDTVLRYLGYAGMLARTVKYGRVAAAPVVANKKLLRGTFLISWGYVFADVVFEADKSHHVYGNGLNEVLRGSLQRFTFQALASIVLPYFTLRHVIAGTRHVITKSGGGLPGPVHRWLPQCVGLGLIPVMPYMWDRPSKFIAKTLVQTAWPGEDDEADE